MSCADARIESPAQKLPRSVDEGSSFFDSDSSHVDVAIEHPPFLLTSTLKGHQAAAHKRTHAKIPYPLSTCLVATMPRGGSWKRRYPPGYGCPRATGLVRAGPAR